jgi:hypothetical protein
MYWPGDSTNDMVVMQALVAAGLGAAGALVVVNPPDL